MKNKIALAMKGLSRRLFKQFVYLLAILVMPGLCFAADQVIISEVLYDPAGTEAGGEAVELYNPTDSAIDISGYVIKTESSATDATIPGGTLLGAKTSYLVADAGWSASKDNASWPAADHEEAITMSNSDAGVALLYSNGTIIDAVGWGDPAGIGVGLFEGTPAALVSAGNSLRRADLSDTGDTDDNSADFVESIPDLQNSSTSYGGAESNSSESITVEVSVENNIPTVDSVSVLGDEDESVVGVQISPMPGESKAVAISAEVTELDGISEIVDVWASISGPGGEKNITLSKAQDLSNVTAEYNATFDMEFYETAGIYNVTVFASDSAVSGMSSVVFDYMSMTAISIDASSLQFAGAKLGGTAEITGDYALSTADSPTIQNIGNTATDFGLYGTDFVDGGKSISIGNVKYSFDNDFGSGLAGTLGNTVQTVTVGLANAADSVIGLGFQLYVPPETQNGNYTGQITVVAVSG
jgi:hypothetical protein